MRSCSRAGKPTDNPVSEPLNGWIKEEPFVDFGLYEAREWEVPKAIDDYVARYNSDRPCWSLGYKTPTSSTRPSWPARSIGPTPSRAGCWTRRRSS